MKNSITLHSIALPLWFLLLSPSTWLVLILTQFIIVSFVLYAGLKYVEYPDPPAIWRKSIIWNTLYGFISYLLICLLFLLTNLPSDQAAFGNWVITNLAQPLNVNPFTNVISLLYVVICLLICGTLVYFANIKLAFRKTQLTNIQKHKVSLCLAIFSAPYIALFPSILLYS